MGHFSSRLDFAKGTPVMSFGMFFYVSCKYVVGDEIFRSPYRLKRTRISTLK